ncbi:MAG: glycoside hydrolase family 5 protein [Planctomycetota bacterium]
MPYARTLAIGVLLLVPFLQGACGSGGSAGGGDVDDPGDVGDLPPPGPPTAPGVKYEMWLDPSRFRGFNINYWNYGTGEKTLADFQALKDTGATVAQIQSNVGTRHWAPPYGPQQQGIDDLDAMVGFCRRVGLQYVIAVRSGPGRRPVDMEARDTIWENTNEEQLYGAMLRDDIVARYHLDPLFVGINVMVEPNPFNVELANGTIDGPGELSTAMAARGIDVNGMMRTFIAKIRTVDPTLPVIVQSVGWSDPAFWSLLEKMPDDYVVYDFHTYSPRDYTHPDCAAPNCGGLGYPGTYDGTSWNRTHLETVHMAEVIAFQAAHDVPILMGEFGMEYPQSGGIQFLSDHADIAVARGWHFILWNFRSDTRDPSTLNFDYEKWPAGYWTEILGWFD